YMAKHPDSPFARCVESGMSGDNKMKLLPWSVFTYLVNMFKELKGAIPYHTSKTDYADSWRKNFLDTSPIVSSYDATRFESPFDYWSSFDGPWRDVFIVFWSKIKKFFANTKEEDARNYWGNPRNSNLFNKISLNILAADFFKFMRERKIELENAEHVG